MMNRGEVYWVDLEPTQGSEIRKKRPCVLIGATAINQVRRTVVVIPLSISATARPPLVVSVTCMNKPVTAVCDQIRTVDKSRLLAHIENLSSQDMIAIENSLRQILAL